MKILFSFKYNPVLFILLAISFTLEVKAQDPEFTQFYANPLYLNPAFAGSARCPRIVMNYRNQWPGMFLGKSTHARPVTVT